MINIERGGRIKGSKNWADEEVRYLQFSWGFVSVKQIAKYLKRTPIAIVVKAKRRKLSSPYKGQARFTARKVADLLGVDIHTVTDYWVGKCGLKSRKMIMRFKKRMFLIDYDNLMDWLEKNQDKWDSRRFKRFTLMLEPEWLRGKRILDSYEPKRKNQKWNELEDLRLLNLFYNKRKKVKEISKIMERSYNGIERRLSRIRPYKKAKRLEARSI